VALTADDAVTFERCMSVGGFAVFPADTVYGLACDPEARETLERIYLLKRRPRDKPSAVLFFDLGLALEVIVPELHAAARALLPGPVTLLVPNPARRFALACGVGGHGIDTLGIRVPRVDTALARVRWPVLQTSANLSGGPDPRSVDEVPQRFRECADLVLDAGPLPGTPSTVVDLREFARDGSFTVVREGALAPADVAAALAECGP